MVDRQQIENAALAAGEGGHLPVDRYRIAAQRGVASFDLRARLRFEPGLEILPVKRMIALGGLGAPHAVQFFDEALDLGDMVLPSRAPFAHSEEQLAAGDFREFDTADPPTGAAIVRRNASTAGSSAMARQAAESFGAGRWRVSGGYPDYRDRANRRPR
jgi:hypothetical protein